MTCRRKKQCYKVGDRFKYTNKRSEHYGRIYAITLDKITDEGGTVALRREGGIIWFTSFVVEDELHISSEDFKELTNWQAEHFKKI